MEISVIWKTSDYRGDHSADVSIAVKANEDTTIKELIEKTLIKKQSKWKHEKYIDHIEIRLIQADLDE